MFDMAARHDAVRSNPMRSVAPVATPDREIRAHTIEDVAELRGLFREWDAEVDKRGMPRTRELADVVDMFLATGCRTGEVLAIEWTAINFDTTPPTVSISGTVAFDVAGKLTIQPHPKSQTSKRQGFFKVGPDNSSAPVDSRTLVVSTAVFTTKVRESTLVLRTLKKPCQNAD